MIPVYEYFTTRRKVAELGTTIKSPTDTEPVLRAMVEGSEVERLVVLVLNARNQVIAAEMVYQGNLAGAPIRIGEVFRLAVRMNGASIVVGHNHPSGDPSPSGDDIRVTGDMADAGRLLDIELLDHIILGDDGRFTSLRATGAL